MSCIVCAPVDRASKRYVMLASKRIPEVKCRHLLPVRGIVELAVIFTTLDGPIFEDRRRDRCRGAQIVTSTSRLCIVIVVDVDLHT